MSLGSIPLTESCENELRRVIERIPDNELSVFAATDPAFQQGGFRPGCKAAILRARLVQLACGPQPLSDTLRRLLARHARTRTLTSLLSPSALHETRHALAALLGADALLIALLLDDRPEVREIAQDALQKPSPFLSADPAEAQTVLRETFSGLCELLDSSAAPGQPVTREAWRQQKEQLELRLSDLNQKLKRLGGAEDRLAGVTRKLAGCESQRNELQTRLEETEKTLRVRTREREELQTELTRECAHRDERLTASLNVALAREFFGWLADARTVADAAADTAPYEDLVARADAALDRQTEIDRHSGNRAVLADRLSVLRAKREQVFDALTNALRQNPNLKTVAADLDTEIGALERLLNPTPPATPLEETLIAQIHATDENELPRLRDLPERMEALRVLDPAAIGRIRTAFQKRLAAVQAVVPPPEPSDEQRASTLTDFGRALTGHTAALLLIDGHNVLFGLPTRYNPPRGTSLTEAEKRKHLTDDVVRLSTPTPTLRVWLVFDGHTRSDAQAAPNVRVTYSGGTGEHRADQVILDNLRFFANASPDVPVFVVSNDSDLCGAARKLGAQTIPVLEFGAFFQAARR